VGVPLLIDTAGQGGLNVGAETVAADFVGMSHDTATYSTVQGIGDSSAQSLVSVIIQPDAVWMAALSGGPTEGTALNQHTVTTANAGGTVITTGTAWDSDNYDEGIVWGYAGANVGQYRKITTTSSTAGTVIVPFDNAINVGDIFLRAPFWPFATTTLQVTSAFFQVDAEEAVATGGEYVVVDHELLDRGGSGTTKSKVFFMARDHVLAGRPT
ncbi:MAG: hypothetical protein IIA33_11555, partial [Planctomycetes bacterium]|nr:hypothetical protein [Planctomycetota bacterium]